MDAQELTRDLLAECPAMATGTLVLRDEAGEIVACGHLKRTGETSVKLTVSASSVVRFPGAFPPAVGG